MSKEAAPQPLEQDGAEFTFAERAKGATFQAVLKRPVTVAAITLVIAVGVFVGFLESGSIEISLPVPEVSYTLLPNEGRTSGVPIAIKLNRIAVFMVNDPLEGGGGAARAQELVDRVQRSVDRAVAERGKSLRIDNETGGLPAIVLTEDDGTGEEVVVQMTQEDLTLAGDTEAKRVARTWAERLTDTLKVIAFAEPPKFTKGTEFGNALTAMYVGARDEKGIVRSSSLNDSFEALPPRQKLALETLPSRSPKPVELEAPEETEVAELGQ